VSQRILRPWHWPQLQIQLDPRRQDHKVAVQKIFSLIMAFRTLLVALLLVAVATAFAPQRRAFRSNTELQFKFLKDLGLEKPSWLPDFGGEKKKEEEQEAKETEASAEEESEEVAAKDE